MSIARPTSRESRIVAATSTAHSVCSFRSNGRDQVGIGITRQSQANDLEISQGVRDLLPELNKSLPKGTVLEVAVDAPLDHGELRLELRAVDADQAIEQAVNHPHVERPGHSTTSPEISLGSLEPELDPKNARAVASWLI